MGTFLQIIGGLALAFVLLIVAGLFYLRWRVRRYASSEAAKWAQIGQSGVAARISLKPLDEPFHHPERIESFIEEIQALGYREVGSYSVPEMPTIQIWGGVHPEDGSGASVVDHAMIEPFFEFCFVSDNDARHTLTVTTNPTHSPTNIRPGTRVIADAAFTPTSARSELLRSAGDEDYLRFDAENFESVFLDLYARQMDFILAKGGPTEADMRREAARMRDLPPLDDAQMQMALQMSRASHQEALEDAIIDRFLKRWDLPAHEWERLRERVVVIHDKMNSEEVCAHALGHVDEDIDEIEVERVLLVSGSRTAAFDALQALLPVSRRHRLIGRTDEPVGAALYEQP
jgi:hypothetical protein